MTIVSNSVGLEKLKKILINDKHFNPSRLNEILKSDLFNLLKDYMEINNNDIITKLEIDENGDYIFRCKVRTNRLKMLGIMP